MELLSERLTGRWLGLASRCNPDRVRFAGTFDRGAELLGLAWGDLDVGAGLLAVRQQVTVRKPPPAGDGSRVGRGVIELSPLKTGSKGRRTLELTPEILKMLKGHRSWQEEERDRAGGLWRESGLIFTTPIGATIEPSSFSHAFSRMAQRAGLGRWHVHEARHTAASLMLAMGTKIEIVSRVLGHSSVTVTADVYSHLLGGEKRRGGRGHDVSSTRAGLRSADSPFVRVPTLGWARLPRGPGSPCSRSRPGADKMAPGWLVTKMAQKMAPILGSNTVGAISRRASSPEQVSALTCSFLAERVGFEPTVSFPTHDFQSCRFGRSRTPPAPDTLA